jgi:hypothetical protein
MTTKAKTTRKAPAPKASAPQPAPEVTAKILALVSRWRRMREMPSPKHYGMSARRSKTSTALARKGGTYNETFSNNHDTRTRPVGGRGAGR